MGEAVETTEVTALAESPVPQFALTMPQMKQLLEERQAFIKQFMIEGVDYGPIPGCGDKPSLFKPGAEKLLTFHGYSVEITQSVQSIAKWDDPGFFHYEYKAVVSDRRAGLVIAECIGSCNSKESRYRWRKAERVCPKCNTPAIIVGKPEYGGGFVCFKKKDGCGAKFRDNDQAITEQPQGRVENDDIFSQVNTIQKIAQKRAIVGAVLIATRASDTFTQDIEDMPRESFDNRPAEPAPAEAPKTKPSAAADNIVDAIADFLGTDKSKPAWNRLLQVHSEESRDKGNKPTGAESEAAVKALCGSIPKAFPDDKFPEPMDVFKRAASLMKNGQVNLLEGKILEDES